MNRICLLLIVGTVACLSTQLTPLAGFNPARAPTCWQGVRIYASPEAIGTTYVELAYLRTEATDPVGDEKVIRNMREKAAEAGANGILFRGIAQRMGGVGWVTGALTAKPEGQGVAIWIPRDSAMVIRLCADSAAADSNQGDDR